ncbi:MAG: hypothetical protein M1831_004586 [Alyxoria varia]|nr:MAG: hypothetical protein M1831_004586 [Alyxoria varia]
MVYSLGYRRPSFHSGASEKSINGEPKQESIDTSVKSTSEGSMNSGIPEALSFDRIINGGTCPPCTLRDFMNYLRYIEHDAENLQFFLWARSYIKKFDSLPEGEKKLSPVWTESQAEHDVMKPPPSPRQMKVSADTADVLKGTGLDSTPRIADADEKSEKSNPFQSPSRSTRNVSEDSGTYNPTDPIPASDHSEGRASSGWPSTHQSKNTQVEVRRKAGDAYEEAGLKWQPFTIQPYRDEIARVVTVYVADGSPRQLNLSGRERTGLLHALENTTHPSALRSALISVEWSLRCQSHPNFIRWTICNGNRPRVQFARGLGIGGIVGGIVLGLLFTLSSLGRAWRVFALLLFFIGISTLIAAIKGMCVVLHGMHHRHLRPWELFNDEDDESVEMKRGDNSSESLLSNTSANSYEDEPWVAKYEKRNIIRKIFDREIWVQEPALRQIQDTIFLQAVLGALIGGAVLTAIFVAVPGGHFY